MIWLCCVVTGSKPIMERLKSANPEILFAIVLWLAGIVIFTLRSCGVWEPEHGDALENLLYFGAGLFGIFGVGMKWYKARQQYRDDD